MPARLSSKEITNAKPKAEPYKLPDGNGLYLEVRPTGKKVWRYRYRLPNPAKGGKPTENVYTAGELAKPRHGESPEERASRIKAGLLTLEEARTERINWRALVKQGLHPGQQRKAEVQAAVLEGQNTFRAVAADWIAENMPGWTPHYLSQVQRGLNKDILPAIGDLPIRSVNSGHIRRIIDAKKTKPTTAILLRQWCGAIFRYAIAHDRADEDPTYATRRTIKRPKVRHHPKLEVREIPGLLGKLEGDTGHRITGIAMELLLLTFTRPSELRAAKWAEFDLNAALWRIPAERMKMREEHLVPISSQALELLRELHAITGGREYLFPNFRNPRQPIAPSTFNRTLERMGYAGRFSPHGFRSTAASALNEMGFRPDLIEKQLAHAERNQSRAPYVQAQYLEERRKMMQTWAEVCYAAGNGAKVIPINKQTEVAA